MDNEAKAVEILRDKKGRPIKQFDLLKMFHFTGARRKKNYMYKWVVEFSGRLYGMHLNEGIDFSRKSGNFLLTQNLLKDAEIVQSAKCDHEERELEPGDSDG